MTESTGPGDPPPAGTNPSPGWGGGFTPDPDDRRPFPEVPDEWVDAQVRELVRAAWENARKGEPPAPNAGRPK